MSTPGSPAGTEPMPSVVTVAHIVYALHTFAIVVGIAGSATVIGSFIGSVPSIVAVILNYVKRGDARGTWAESTTLADPHVLFAACGRSWRAADRHLGAVFGFNVWR
jgi:uncharacterized membrane protein